MLQVQMCGVCVCVCVRWRARVIFNGAKKRTDAEAKWKICEMCT